MAGAMLLESSSPLPNRLSGSAGNLACGKRSHPSAICERSSDAIAPLADLADLAERAY
jgi:hypothetical protein